MYKVLTETQAKNYLNEGEMYPANHAEFSAKETSGTTLPNHQVLYVDP